MDEKYMSGKHSWLQRRNNKIVFLEEIIMGNNSNLEKKEQNIRPKNL
jgi:hypothetical protein